MKSDVGRVGDAISLQCVLMNFHGSQHGGQILAAGLFGGERSEAHLHDLPEFDQHVGGLRMREGESDSALKIAAGDNSSTTAPTLALTLTNRSDSSDFTASRTQVRLTPSSAVSCFSVGSFSPGLT